MVWNADRRPYMDNVMTETLALTVLLFAAIFGGVALAVLADDWHGAAAVVDTAAGRDMCVLLDGKGSEASRVFVDAVKPCPDPGEWHAVERVANGDLTGRGVGAHWVVIAAVVFCAGTIGSVIILRR